MTNPSIEPVEIAPTGDSRPDSGRVDPLAVLLPGFAGTELPGWVAARLRAGLAGVCLFGENIESPAQLRRLTDAIRLANPLALIAIDEEGGDVTRLYYGQGSPFAGNAILGRIDDEQLTERVAAEVGRRLRRVGCNLDFAPDVDVNSNPQNPVIGVRSFGAEPGLVARHSAAWTRALQGEGVAAAAKHFPGHGDTARDSHLALPVVDRSLAQLRERELVPFVAAIAAGTRAIMTSHILLPRLDPQLPATLSPRILQGLLREELGFDGVIVSDALDMAGASGGRGIPEAAVLAIGAGCDLLCIGTRTTDAQLGTIERALLDAVGSGRLPAARLADAGQRTVALGRDLAQAPPLPLSGTGAAFDAEPSFDLGRTAAAFDVRPGIAVQPHKTIVVLDTASSLAVGAAPWGPAAGIRLAEGDPLPAVEGQLIVVGRDNHRHEWVRRLVERARAEEPGMIVIDMGWPGDDREYADVATFGASRQVGQALELWLATVRGRS